MQRISLGWEFSGPLVQMFKGGGGWFQEVLTAIHKGSQIQYSGCIARNVQRRDQNRHTFEQANTWTYVVWYKSYKLAENLWKSICYCIVSLMMTWENAICLQLQSYALLRSFKIAISYFELFWFKMIHVFIVNLIQCNIKTKWRGDCCWDCC